MKDALQTIFGLLGGLGLFIFGMNRMSDSLQKVAGERMKKILAVLTKNPVLGVLAGVLLPSIILFVISNLKILIDQKIQFVEKKLNVYTKTVK